MQMRCSRHFDALVLDSMGQTSNTRSFWPDMPPIASRAKRLMPFLPTLLEALERHEHLHLTAECLQLLSVSAATADRLLRTQRKRGLRGLYTTRAGTLLKQQIPIRAFAEWSDI